MPAIAKVLSLKVNDMGYVSVASCYGLIAQNDCFANVLAPNLINYHPKKEQNIAPQNY
jgi:hypothetical protein